MGDPRYAYYTIEELAELWGMSVDKIEKYTERGQLHCDSLWYNSHEDDEFWLPGNKHPEGPDENDHTRTWFHNCNIYPLEEVKRFEREEGLSRLKPLGNIFEEKLTDNKSQTNTQKEDGESVVAPESISRVPTSSNTINPSDFSKMMKKNWTNIRRDYGDKVSASDVVNYLSNEVDVGNSDVEYNEEELDDKAGIIFAVNRNQDQTEVVSIIMYLPSKRKKKTIKLKTLKDWIRRELKTLKSK